MSFWIENERRLSFFQLRRPQPRPVLQSMGGPVTPAVIEAIANLPAWIQADLEQAPWSTITVNANRGSDAANPACQFGRWLRTSGICLPYWPGLSSDCPVLGPGRAVEVEVGRQGPIAELRGSGNPGTLGGIPAQRHRLVGLHVPEELPHQLSFRWNPIIRPAGFGFSAKTCESINVKIMVHSKTLSHEQPRIRLYRRPRPTPPSAGVAPPGVLRWAIQDSPQETPRGKRPIAEGHSQETSGRSDRWHRFLGSNQALGAHEPRIPKTAQKPHRRFSESTQVWWAQRDLNPRPSDYESLYKIMRWVAAVMFSAKFLITRTCDD